MTRIILTTIGAFIVISTFLAFAGVKTVQAECGCNESGDGWSCIPNCIGGPPTQSCGDCTGGTRCQRGGGCGGDSCSGNTNCGECGNAACCSRRGPAAVTSLTAPALAAVNVDLPVTFSWGGTSDWGEGCASSDSYTVFGMEKTTANCSTNYALYSAWASNGANTSATMSDAVANTLKWGSAYCWFVRTSNNGQNADSGTSYFTTTAPPTISNVQIINAINCGGAKISGLATNPDVNNPITIQMDIADVRNNFASNANVFAEVRVGILPAIQQNSAAVIFSALDQVLKNNLGFRGTPVKVGVTPFSAVNTTSSPYFGAAVTSGTQLKNAAGTASLLSLNIANATNITQVNNTTLRVTWQIRFESTFPTAVDNIYAAVTSTTPTGKIISQDPHGIGANALYYDKVLGWQTDMNAPQASVSAPTATSTNTFFINWNASDTEGALRDVRSYCYTTLRPATMLDSTLGQTLNLDKTPLAFPQAGNCLVNKANIATVKHNYTLFQTYKDSDIAFGLFAEDAACNDSTSGKTLASPAAWAITTHGEVSAKGGFVNYTIRNVASLAGVVPNLGADAFLSTYEAIAGNTSMLTQLQSKFNFYATSYDDKALDPPAISGIPLWFDYLFQNVATRHTVPSSALTSINGSFSSAFGAAASATIYEYVQGDLTVNPNSVCDVDGVIFVKGNLVVQPNLTKASSSVGCVFIVKGDITIAKGTDKSTGSVTQPANYDIVEGAFITDGNFITSKDQINNGGVTTVGDGVYIHGTVYSSTISLYRDLGINQNSLQPSEVFDYDPSYARIFRSLLGIRTFSLRAQ